MRQAAATVWSSYCRAWRLRGPFVTAHLAMSALAFAVVTPLVAALMRLAIALSGEPALADQDIAIFLLSPVGLLCLVAAASVLITAAVLETAVMMSIDLADRRGARLRLFGGLRHVLGHLPRVLLFAVLLVVRVLLISGPFLAVAGFIAWRWLTEYDINYYLAEHPPVLLAAAGAIGLLLAALAALLASRLLSWSLGLPGLLFCEFGPRTAFAESARLMQGHRMPFLWQLVIWGAAAFAIGATLLGAVGLIAGLALPAAGLDLGRLALVLWAVALIWVIANLLAGALGAGSISVLLVAHMQARGAPVAASFASGADAGRVSAGIARRVVLGAGFAAAVGLIAGSVALDRLRVGDDVLVIAHRGAAGARPENTLASVRKAIEDGADYVEIDVQETADGEVVVVHDSDFMKLAGVDLKVWDATMADLEAIDIGSWFGPEYAGERTPTLRAVLEEAKGRSRVLVELKFYGHDERLAERVARVVEETGMVDSVAFMSLHYPQVQRMKALRPDWRVGLLAATAVGDLTRLEADFLAVNAGMASARFIRRARDAGRNVYVWTLNDPLAMSKMASRGAAGLITDEPGMAREVLADRADLSTPERLVLAAVEILGLKLNPKAYRDDAP